MSDYDFRPGGSLKLKGVVEGGVTKKCASIVLQAKHHLILIHHYRKKKKDKASKLKAETKEELRKLVDEGAAEGSSRKTDRSNSVDVEDNGKTEAERRFEEIQRRRVRLVLGFPTCFYVACTDCSIQMEARVKKLAKQTHKDRVHLFNEKLEALSEHHDIPKASKCTYSIGLEHCSHWLIRLAQDKTCYILDFVFPVTLNIPKYLLNQLTCSTCSRARKL